jgi:hypothetical protein
MVIVGAEVGEEEMVSSSYSSPNVFRDSIAMVTLASDSFSFLEKDSLYTSYQNRACRNMVLRNTTHHSGTDVSLVHNPGGIPSMYQAAEFPEAV